MDTWLQETFSHGYNSEINHTVAGWLNELSKTHIIQEVMISPLGEGHGQLVLVRCIPHDNVTEALEKLSLTIAENMEATTQKYAEWLNNG